MQTSKKKPFWPMIGLGAFFAAYLGYLIGAAWVPGRKADEFLAVFSYVLERPFALYFNVNTPKCILFSLTVYAIVILMYYTSQRNLMPGKEYGTAKFANVKQVSKVLEDKDEYYNRVLSQNVKMSLNTRHTKLNNNVLIIGGAGSGKTFFEVKPNLMQMPRNCSFVITDPKGELLRSCAGMLKKNGYKVKVLNLIEMEKSNCYNPFSYIREETDIVKLITNLIKNTTPKGSTPNDPFWEKSESLFLQAIFYYVWMEVKPEKRNFETVLKLVGEAKVSDKGEPSRLDLRMKFLEETHPLKDNHPAVKQYNKCMRGAGDTIRSIIISVNARLAYLENKQILRILSKDEMDIADLGIGANGDGETKTALFCVIPDSDKSYNFVVGLLYSQIFQELYYQADFNCGGRLPIHVTFMMDEFANVALPDDFCSLLSTMRSREISCMIIIQNLAQIKALFKDTWETIPGNSDTLIFLGGNEQGTHEYVSKLLGKATIEKRSSGETRGRQGSSSRNYDVLGRELFTPDEVRKLDNKKCLIFIRGMDPIIDDKFNPFKHKAFSQTEDGGAPAYIHDNNEAAPVVKSYELLTKPSLKYYEKLKEKGENVFIDTIKYEELSMLTETDMNRRIVEKNESEARDKMYQEIASSLEYQDPKMEQEYVEDMDEAFAHRNMSEQIDTPDQVDISNSVDGVQSDENGLKKIKYQKSASSVTKPPKKTGTFFDKVPVNSTETSNMVDQEDTDAIINRNAEAAKKLPSLNGNDTIISRMTTWNYSKEQIEALNKAYKLKMPLEKILKFFYPDVTVEDMNKAIAKFDNNDTVGAVRA